MNRRFRVVEYENKRYIELDCDDSRENLYSRLYDRTYTLLALDKLELNPISTLEFIEENQIKVDVVNVCVNPVQLVRGLYYVTNYTFQELKEE